MKEHKSDAKVFSQLETLEDFLNTDEDDSLYLQKKESARKKLTTIKNEQDEYSETFLINRRGEVASSSSFDQAGSSVKETDYFQEAKEAREPFFGDFHFNESIQKISMSVYAPVHHDRNGEFLGVFVSRINKEELYKVLVAREGISSSGQTYLINGDLQLISPDIYGSQLLERKIDTENSRNCFQMAGVFAEEDGRKNMDKIDNPHSEFSHRAVESFVNYENEKVLGTHSYISETNWCLLSEVEAGEALYSNQKVLYYLSGLSALAVLIYFLLAAFISRIITRPIERLHHGTEVVEKGDLDYKVGMKRKDEIGQLSRSFDKMVESIKEARSEIDEKVKQQTKEIKEKASYLEDQRKAILNILEDVEEEKQKTKREKDKIDAILQSIGDAVFVVNQESEIIMFNKIAEQLSGYSSKEAMGANYKKILKFVFEKNEKENDEFIKKAMETGEIKEMANHTMLVSKSGKKIPVADSASPLKDHQGNIKGCVVVFRDVTREREIDRAKTEFVSLASHQLRTPLSSINWYTEMLINGDAGEINKDQKDFLKEIYKGNQRMVDLVNALLNVSRIEMGTLAVEPEPANFNEIAESVMKEVKPQAEKKKHKIEKDLDSSIPEIQADSKLVRIVFQNLATNAIKYTPEGGKISLETKKEDDSILIKVSDNGYGIPKNQQDKIFSKLFRADNVQEKDAEGTGLGLYIIKAIVEQCGGEIWFESAKDKGTTFFVRFPLAGMRKQDGSRGLNEIK